MAISFKDLVEGLLRGRELIERARKQAAKKPIGQDEIRKRYDFSGGERGKYADSAREGTKVVIKRDK